MFDMKVDHQYCEVCDKTNGFFNGKCGDCTRKERDKQRRVHFASLQGLTIEERLDRLEKWQYEIQQSPPWIEPTY